MKYSLNRRLLVLTTSYLPRKSPLALVVSNLFERLTGDIILAIDKWEGNDIDIGSRHKKVLNIPNHFAKISADLNNMIESMFTKYYAKKLIRSIDKFIPDLIFSIYPNPMQVFQGSIISNMLQIPAVLWLHNTIYYANKSRIPYFYKWTESVALEGNYKYLFVLSEGLKEIYQEKTEKPLFVLPHINDIISINNGGKAMVKNNTVGWSGRIYGANRVALRRICKIMAKMGFIINFTKALNEEIEKLNIPENSYNKYYFENRSEYMQYLSNNQYLLLALNWPDEADNRFSIEELYSNFPTKVFEYLSARRPIILHCPSQYFLAKWMENNQCGLIISERDDEAIIQKIVEFDKDKERQEYYVENGIKALKYFDPDRVLSEFITLINNI